VITGTKILLSGSLLVLNVDNLLLYRLIAYKIILFKCVKYGKIKVEIYGRLNRMSNEIYNGNSDGFRFLVDGYLDYSKEVIARRAIPDLRDGLKPVQRRILYSAKINDKKQFQKCAVFVADAMKLHPHGDSSVYGAFVLMSDSNGSWNVPVFEGMGNLGKVYSSNPPAAYRYPKAKLHSNSDDYFNEKNILNLVQSEEGDGVEPEVLLPNYPTVLVNGTSGIAVSVGTRIPSFNFKDVIDLTIKYIKQGNLDIVHDIIYPDFPTGGVLVKSDSEVAKIMATGQGKLKIRAKVEIRGKEIIVKEVPYGKTIEGIIKAINAAEIKEISSVTDSRGIDTDDKITIICRSKRVVEWVLLELYRKNILQNIYSSNMFVVCDGKPYMMGVHEVIDRWVEFRRATIQKKFDVELKGIKSELITLDYFIRLISNKEWRDTYVSKATKVSKKEADGYLHEIFSDIPDDVCDWISKRSISAFNNGGRYSNRYSELSDYKTYCEDMFSNPNKYIITELEGLISKHSEYCKRKTMISKVDYRFSKIEETEGIVDDSPCVYILTKEGFIYKNRDDIDNGEDIMCKFRGQANSVVVGFDNYGRVLRISGLDIPYAIDSSDGLYLPKYFDATFQEDYRVLYMCVCDGTTKLLVYRDGYAGFFDTSEWLDKKVVKVISKGVSTAVMDKLLEVYDEIPQFLVLADDTGKYVKICVVDTANIPDRHRSSRAKIMQGTGIDTHYIKGFMRPIDLHSYIRDPQQYVDKLTTVKTDTFAGDVEEMLEGKYLDICKDLV